MTRSANGYTTVCAGTRLPGVVFDVGAESFGVAVGYQVRERLQAVRDGVNGVSATVNGHELSPDTGCHWSLGQFKLRVPPSNAAIVSGCTDIGIGGGIEQGWPVVTVGARRLECTTVNADDAFVELTVPQSSWPFVNIADAELVVVENKNTPKRSTAP